MSLLDKIFRRSQLKAAAEKHSGEFISLIQESHAHLGVLMAGHELAWGFGKQTGWDLDRRTGVLRFTFDGGIVVSGPAQIIATVDTATRSFQWAWHDESVRPAMKVNAETLREYGRQHNIKLLSTPAWETDGEWPVHIAALAVKLCNTYGAFRGSTDATDVYVTFGQLIIRNS